MGAASVRVNLKWCPYFQHPCRPCSLTKITTQGWI